MSSINVGGVRMPLVADTPHPPPFSLPLSSNPEEAAFLGQILANPRDDTVRLVYADWLSEHGQEERGEFIRAQIRIARRDTHPGRLQHTLDFTRKTGANAGDREFRGIQEFACRADCPLCEHLRDTDLVARIQKRNMKLERPHLSWFPLLGRDHGHGEGLPLRWWLGSSLKTLHRAIEGNVSRGFVYHIQISQRDYLAHAASIFREHPIEQVSFPDVSPIGVHTSESPGQCGREGWVFDRAESFDQPLPPRHLHHMLYDVLVSRRWSGGSPFDKHQNAMEALSNAAVCLGRKEAGLPELP